MNQVNRSFQDEKYWTDTWIRYINTYLDSAPRAGYWLSQVFNKKQKILEIAGGSCRDSKFLFEKGFASLGTDFDQKTLDYLKKEHSFFNLKKEDAFNLSFKDDEFQISFSNGFWVLFDDNEVIYSLIKEQARVTEQCLVSFIHNKKNIKLVQDFNEKSNFDDLYKIRFFDKDEIIQIVHDSGIKYKKIKIKKFGGIVDRLLSKKIKSKSLKLHDIFVYVVPKLYKFLPWSKVERIVVMVEF